MILPSLKMSILPTVDDEDDDNQAIFEYQVRTPYAGVTYVICIFHLHQ